MKSGKVDGNMLYFDNAATSFPKPVSVRKAVEHSFLQFGANPGRSGHKMGMDTTRKIFECRQKAANLFGINDPENIAFTKNCTEAINAVIMSIAKPGDHFIISDLEHNSVLRPLYELKNRGIIDFSVAKVFECDPKKTVKSYEKLIKPNTKMLIATGASNAFGIKLPVKMLAKLANEHGLLFMLDGAQIAGAQKTDMQKDGFDFVCAPGHKGLLGPMGTGLVAAKKPELLQPLLYGGTGSYSLLPQMPEEMPEKLEAGTVNVPGICGLCAGIDFVLKNGEEQIAEKEIELAKMLYSELSAMDNVTLYTQMPEKESHSAVISFNLGDLTGEETAELLSKKEVATRGGFHCAALAHQKMGTEKRGTCRISLGAMSNFDETLKLIKIINSLTKST